MTREKCEQLIANKMKEIINVLKEYDCKATYLSLSYIDGSIGFNNDYYIVNEQHKKIDYYESEVK